MLTSPHVLARLQRSYALILVLFFFSGASGLVYEVLWVRMLALVFGTTTLAVSTILTCFMAGLGLGSYLSGRHLAGRRRPLVIFGVLECGVGLCALALPSLLPVLERAFTAAASALGVGAGGEALLRVPLSLVALLPPTALMGASLPLLAQHTVERFAQVGVRVGSLYALNTLGAAAGCFAAGFAAIPALGVRGTTLAAAAVNGIVGILAIAIGVRLTEGRPSPPAEGEDPRREEDPRPLPERAVWLAMTGVAVSGFAALGLEVIWTRLIALVFIGETYSFTTMLTVFLLGIAGGSLAFGRLADRSRDPLRLFGLLAVGAGLSALATSALFRSAQGWLELLAPRLGAGWAGIATAKFAVGFALLIVPTFFFGATFPVVSRIAARNLEGVGDAVGRLYAANVAGGIAGAFVTGFLLMRIAGTDASLRILSTALLVLGLLIVAASPASAPRTKGALALAAAAGAALVVALVPPDPSRAIHRRWLRPGERMGFYKEGVAATVMVGEVGDAQGRSAKRILVSGSSASNSTYYGLSVNRIQGALPFLFERMPRRVLALCFGTGITFGTVSQFEVDRIDGVEISPEVIQAAPRFAAENYEVVRSARFRIHIDDGRNFLLKSRERYDAITMEPMPPSLAGVVNFYTLQFYELCRARLAPGGIVSQWVPLYGLGLEDVRMLYRTFAESFPHAMVFRYGYDTFMVGSDRPLGLSGARFCDRLRSDRLRRDLAAIHLDSPDRMLGTFLMGREAMRRFAGSAAALSDDLPYVEFTGPKVLVLAPIHGNVQELMRYGEPASGYLVDGPDAEALRLRASLDALFAEDRERWAGADSLAELDEAMAAANRPTGRERSCARGL